MTLQQPPLWPLSPPFPPPQQPHPLQQPRRLQATGRRESLELRAPQDHRETQVKMVKMVHKVRPEPREAQGPLARLAQRVLVVGRGLRVCRE